MEQTFVYVIGADTGPQKVGFAKSTQLRLEGLQTGSPFNLKIHYEAPFNSDRVARKVERMTHRLLAGHRQRGEWFNVTPQLAIETVRLAATGMPGHDDPLAQLVRFRARGVLTWDEYEAAVAYAEVRSAAERRHSVHEQRHRGSVERSAMAAAVLNRLNAEIVKSASREALQLLIMVAGKGVQPTEAEMGNLRSALVVVSDELERAISAQAA